MIQYCIILVVLLFTQHSGPGIEASGDLYNRGDSFHATVQDTAGQSKLRLMLLPILFRSPDTGFAGGVLQQLIFRSAGASNPSTLRLDAYYTQENQYHILLRSNNWIRNDQLNLSGKLSVRHWPTSFYGIGNDTSDDDKESFTESLYDISLGARKLIAKSLYLGGGATLRYAEIETFDTSEHLNSGNIAGSGNSFVTGISSDLTYDTRDNHFYPTTGSNHKLNLFGTLKNFGSQYSFLQLSLDARKYVSLPGKQSLAFRGISTFSFGEMPFRMLPAVGGSLRGYPSSRYIDRHLVSIQVEYRVVPVFWRLGFVIFAGTGDVFSGADDIRFNNFKHMAGMGLRYVIFRDENINIRFDFGIGRQSSGDYIDLTEAY